MWFHQLNKDHLKAIKHRNQILDILSCYQINFCWYSLLLYVGPPLMFTATSFYYTLIKGYNTPSCFLGVYQYTKYFVKDSLSKVSRWFCNHYVTLFICGQLSIVGIVDIGFQNCQISHTHRLLKKYTTEKFVSGCQRCKLKAYSCWGNQIALFCTLLTIWHAGTCFMHIHHLNWLKTNWTTLQINYTPRCN